jgi:predicted TIM-barrel fold metal-dependent hydrolase
LGGAPDFGLERSPPGWLSQPNVFFKFSTTNLYILEEAKIPERAYLRFLVDRVGAKRILWGSDIGTSGGSYLELAQRARAATATLTPAEQRQVLRETGMTVFAPAG